ncbi:MAG: 30S ribosome-binding factor RbfA [Hyphomicrobiales bacterium]|nr:30S ribosome-binding factor RbfA [Hyphomicrobiales bacterium]
MAQGRNRNDPSQRQRRVGELLRHAMAEIFLRTDISDPDLAGVTVTVTEVEVSPDLKNARVFVVPLGGTNQEEVLAALGRNTKFLRGEMARHISLKFTPTLTFELDATFDQSDRVNALLHSGKVAQDLR